jgi:hypothetical protein
MPSSNRKSVGVKSTGIFGESRKLLQLSGKDCQFILPLLGKTVRIVQLVEKLGYRKSWCKLPDV